MTERRQVIILVAWLAVLAGLLTWAVVPGRPCTPWFGYTPLTDSRQLPDLPQCFEDLPKSH